MRELLYYWYCCFYYVTIGRKLKHFRAAFGASITISILFIALINLVVFGLKLHLHLAVGLIMGIEFALAIGLGFYMDKLFSQRTFYMEALSVIEKQSNKRKMYFGVVGGLLLVGCWGALIMSFLIFRTMDE